MKKYYIYLLSLIFLPFVFSCEMKKDLLGGIEKPTDPQLPKDAGMLDLELNPEKEVVIPTSKGDEIEGSDEILDAADFSVGIYDEEGRLVESYDNYAQLKETGGLLLSPGTYVIKAEKGNDLNAGFDKPYYKGVDTCIIQPQVVEKVITSCKLENKKVTFRYSEDFQKQFEEDYFVVVDNGSGVLTLDKDETRSAFLKNTGTLRFTVYVTSKAGKQLIYNYDVSKNEQVNQHNNVVIDLGLINDNDDSGNSNPGDGGSEGDDDEPEDPGDTPPDIPTRKPTLSVDVSLVEKDFIIEIPSDILNSGGDDNTGGGEEQPGVDPSEQSPTIAGTMDGKSFDMNAKQTISASTNSVVINLYLPTGLESLTVRVNIPNVPIDLPLDLLNEDDPNLIEIKGVLSGMDKVLLTPVKGAKGNQKFDISPFLDLLVQVGGDSSFAVSMKDKNGKSVNQTLKLTVK